MNAMHTRRRIGFANSSLALCAALGVTLGIAAGSTHAQSVPGDLKPTETVVAGRIDRVVVYEEGAVVTRSLNQRLAQGIWAVRVTGLPEGVHEDALQAKVSLGAEAAGQNAGAAPKLLGVEYSETPLPQFTGTPEGMALAKRVKDLQRDIQYAAQDSAQLEQQAKLVEQIGVRATANATNDAGTQALSLDALRQQLEFVAKERTRIVEARRALEVTVQNLQLQLAAAAQELESRGGASLIERSAVITVAVSQEMPVDMTLSYTLDNASWQPAYSVRSAGDRTGVQIEYDAIISQSTGENWTDVAMTLSTATPQRDSTPPAIEPWFVDIFNPAAQTKSGHGGGGGGGFGGGGGGGSGGGNIFGAPGEAAERGDSQERGARIESLARSASVEETGTALSYDIPRRITVPSDSEKTQRTRVATIDPTVTFIYTAQPLVTEDLYLRGDLENTSAYQLLPGEAQIFMGGDFIGNSYMPSVAPKDKFKVSFGPDRALRAKRLITSRTTGASGLFGGGVTTTWNYRISIDNGTGKDVKIELLDRIPVSRNEKITVELTNLSAPLSTDAHYLGTERPQGILRWDMTVPATARGESAKTVTWTVNVGHSSSVKTTPLPD